MFANNPRPEQLKRIAIVSLTYEALIALIQGGHSFRSNLPADAELVAVENDPGVATLRLQVRSASFAPTAPTDSYPRFEVRFQHA